MEQVPPVVSVKSRLAAPWVSTWIEEGVPAVAMVTVTAWNASAAPTLETKDTPAPLMVAVCGVLLALSVMDRVVDSLPVALGVKVT